MYTKDDILRALKKASEEVTDDCQMAGVLTAGALILGISEDAVNEELNKLDPKDVEYITFDVVERLWNDYAIGFEYADGSDTMCQDSGWTLEDAENALGSGRFFVEKPLTGRWSRTANPVNGEMLHSVYRLRDITKIDSSGNRELATKYWCNKVMMERLAEELNIRGVRDLDDAMEFAEDFIGNYLEFEPWEVTEDLPVPYSGYSICRCVGCDDEQVLYSCDDKDICEQIAKELNTQQIADIDTARIIANSIIKEDNDKPTSFLDDQCKMVDFFWLSRSEFLAAYSYITEADYDQTCYDVLERAGYENIDGIDPSDMVGKVVAQIVDGIQKQEWLLSKGGEKNA